MVLSYAIAEAPTDNPDDLPAPIAPFVALEKLSVDTWFSKLSIQVYAQNTGALRLYDRLGYALVAREPVRLHLCPPYHTGDVLLLMKNIKVMSCVWLLWRVQTANVLPGPIGASRFGALHLIAPVWDADRFFEPSH